MYSQNKWTASQLFELLLNVLPYGSSKRVITRTTDLLKLSYS